MQGGLRPGAYLRERLFGRRTSNADKTKQGTDRQVQGCRSSSQPPTTPSEANEGSVPSRSQNNNKGLCSVWNRLSRPGRSLSAEPNSSSEGRSGGEAAAAADEGVNDEDDNQVPKPRLRKKGNGTHYRNPSTPAWEERVTYYVKQNCNPKWDDQSFVFDLSPEAPVHPRMFWLRVRVLDYDFLAASSFLGQVR